MNNDEPIRLFFLPCFPSFVPPSLFSPSFEMPLPPHLSHPTQCPPCQPAHRNPVPDSRPSFPTIPSPRPPGRGVPGGPTKVATPTLFSTVYPTAAFAPPAAQRGPPIRFAYARPGMPSWASVYANTATSPLSPIDTGLDILRRVFLPFPKEGASSTFADRLWTDLGSYLHGTADPVLSLLIWLAVRSTSLQPASVRRYLAWIAPRFALTYGIEPMRHPAVAAFLARLAAIAGTIRSQDRPSMASDEYATIIASKLVPRWLKAAMIIAWRRMARIADVAELREGDLWVRHGNTVWVAQSFHKTAAAGAYDRLVIDLTDQERLVLGPWIATLGPTSHPLARPPMFPALTATLISDILASVLGRRVGAHSIRRSALRTALDAGVPVPAAILLTMHRDAATALAYALYPDVSTADTMAQASAATTSRLHPRAPTRHPGGY